MKLYSMLGREKVKNYCTIFHRKMLSINLRSIFNLNGEERKREKNWYPDSVRNSKTHINFNNNDSTTSFFCWRKNQNEMRSHRTKSWHSVKEVSVWPGATHRCVLFLLLLLLLMFLSCLPLCFCQFTFSNVWWQSGTHRLQKNARRKVKNTEFMVE